MGCLRVCVFTKLHDVSVRTYSSVTSRLGIPVTLHKCHDGRVVWNCRINRFVSNFRETLWIEAIIMYST